MKFKTKWGTGVNKANKIITCPSCGASFVNRRRKHCLECKIKLFVGSELLTDPNGFWWHPELHKWIPVSHLYSHLKEGTSCNLKCAHSSAGQSI